MKNEIELLNEKILSLESKREYEVKLLKEHLYSIHEELKPINLIKNDFKEITTSPEAKNTLIDNVIGLGTGYISRKILVGSSHNPIKNLLGTLLQFTISNMATKHSDKIKTAGENLFDRVIKFTKQLKH